MIVATWRVQSIDTTITYVNKNQSKTTVIAVLVIVSKQGLGFMADNITLDITNLPPGQVQVGQTYDMALNLTTPQD